MILRKEMVGVLSLAVMLGLNTQAQQVEWADGWLYGQTFLFDSGGANITDDGAWVYQIVADVNNDTDFEALIAAGESGMGWGIGSENHMYSGTTADYNADDDIVIGQNVWLADPGGDSYMESQTTFMQNPDSSAILWNTTFYFRWFNAEDPAMATEGGIIYNPIWVIPAEASPPPMNNQVDLSYPADVGYGQDVNAGLGSNLAGDGWQSMPLVPEPGTFALFGIGLLTVAARRKLRKKA